MDKHLWHCRYCHLKKTTHNGNESISDDQLKTRNAPKTSSNTSLVFFFNPDKGSFRRQEEDISLSSSTTDKHRHIKTSSLRSSNSSFNSRQTQLEELNYRTGATQPFLKITLTVRPLKQVHPLSYSFFCEVFCVL